MVRPEQLTRASPHASQARLRRGQPLHASADGLPARPALTRFEVLARSTSPNSRAAACLVRPVTGRMHQIRVHAEHLGFPLAGDGQYGLERQPRGDDAVARLLLHAYSLRVAHPTDGRLVTFNAPPPEAFATEAAALGVPEAALARLQGEASAVWEEEE